MSAASPGRMIQHLPHQKAAMTETSFCVIRLLLLSQKEIGCCVCLSECLCLVFLFFSVGRSFFACAHFPLPSYVETMQDIGSLFLILTRYWFIIFDSRDICSFNSPLRVSFQSLLEVEAEENNTERMISGFNFNGNCQLFPYSIIFLGNNS